MVELIKSGTYINSYRTYIKDGNTFYAVRGYHLGRKYRYSGNPSNAAWDGATRDPQQAMNWCQYLQETTYNLLPQEMKDRFNNKIVMEGGLQEYPVPYFDETRYAYGIDPSKVYESDTTIPGEDVVIPGEEYDTCEGVVCSDTECVGTDLYDQVCDDGICIRGVLIESNSYQCGYTDPIAKGKLDIITWNACHDIAGCSTEKAYWGSKVTIFVDCINVGNAVGQFKVKITNGGTIMGESGFETIGINSTFKQMVSFTMPEVSVLTLKVELIRNV